jgi:hypothetical protein
MHCYLKVEDEQVSGNHDDVDGQEQAVANVIKLFTAVSYASS